MAEANATATATSGKVVSRNTPPAMEVPTGVQ